MNFIDTNVLVYATARNAPFCDQARAALSRLAADEPLSVSRQILREYIAAMTRQQIWGKPLSPTEAAADAATFADRFTPSRTARRSGIGSSSCAAAILSEVVRSMTPMLSRRCWHMASAGY